MFWKIARPTFPTMSIATKLALLYTFSTFCLLIALSLFLYPIFTTLLSEIQGSHLVYIKAFCYRYFIVALLLSAMSAIGFGFWVAKNGLGRVHEFSKKIRDISTDSLHERIHPEDWPYELKAVSHEFNQMMDRIQNGFVRLSQFSADIAHELRNPLHNLMGMTELALSKESHPPASRQLLEANLREFQQLSKLINNLLFLARTDQQQIQLKWERIDVRSEMDKIIAYFQPVVDENPIEILCSGNAMIWGDVILFQRIINNLLSNAIKYTPPYGKITFTIEHTAPNRVEVVIQDTGVGMAESHLAKIFDRFYRVDSSRTTESGGLGLGLAIVKSIMDLHHAEIRMESELRRGTQVYLIFPANCPMFQ